MIRTILTRHETEAPQFQEVRVRLPNFEGPLDLLLYLIRRDRIEIWEISLERITEQYLAHLELMRVLNMEIAGEFLVMAATLMRMKSQMLLPRAEPVEEEGEEPITQEELIERLVRYQALKGAAQELRRREDEASRSYPRGMVPRLPDDYLYPLKPVNLYTLAEALQEILSRARGEEPGHEVVTEDVRLEDQMQLILRSLRERGGRLLFHDLFRPPYRPLEVAVTFLALLELCRLQQTTVCQLWAGGEIWVLLRRRREASGAGDGEGTP
jgi:segregation and condensation protein A